MALNDREMIRGWQYMLTMLARVNLSVSWEYTWHERARC